jgi:HSP20 family molecular chaperone IbpA
LPFLDVEMRYRLLTYGHSLGVRSSLTRSFGYFWMSDRLPLLAPARWRPNADTYETSSTVEVVVELAAVDEDALEIRLFEDVLVVEGHRELPACREGAVFHAAGIHQGPFRLELPLPAPVDAGGTEARLERGLLLITLPKRAGAP